jgi:hypothetical protein
MGSDPDEVEAEAAGDAGADVWDGDDDPGAFGAGLKMHVCSWEAQT